MLLASGTFIFNPAGLSPYLRSTQQEKNETFAHEEQAEIAVQDSTDRNETPKHEETQIAVVQDQTPVKAHIYPRTVVLSPSVFNATIPDHYASHDLISYKDGKLFYKNYTDDYIPKTRNNIPLFEESCVPYKEWQTAYYPNCNSFHSLEYSDMELLGVGNARIVWKLGQQDDVALKMTRMNHFKTERSHYESWRIDAMISERLTSSPRVLNIYGHCGVTTLNQVGDIRKDWTHVRRPPKQKWSLALQLARAVQDVHSIDGGDNVTAIWHNVKPDNVLFLGDKLVITDFDESVLPRWNEKEQKPCKIHYRNEKLKLYQPLELYIPGAESDHTIDIYSLGVMMLAILAGTGPRIPGNGALPSFPPRRLPKDATSKKIQSIAAQCMALNPHKRPTAQQVVQNLEKAISRKS